ncbi:histidine kinase [Microbacterium maritypicum]|uniref:sensor histidine kinase n=1 Tax=Microbacterium maritypicum TaxID=33918 RepID=UPI00296E274C|nr:histidine kinase [Microbacterium liquefaciens]
MAGGKFTRYDLLAVAFYAGLAAFAWHPMTAAFIVMLISSVGVVFTESGGDLLELAIALSLVAVTCAPWVIVAHVVLLGLLTTFIAVDTSTLATGGVFGIVGIAAIAFLVGVAFRLVAARETVLVAERARVAQNLAAIAREDQEQIADELHDGIAHDLTLILFHARALPRQPDQAAREVSLTTIEESAEQALHSIHSLLSLMRDTATEGPETRSSRYDGSAVEAVNSLGDLLRDAGVQTKIAVPSAPLEVAPAAEQVLIETAIEAVMNIIKHSPKSKTASIEIHDGNDRVELIVENAGSSSASSANPAPGGRGLRRARQRLEQIDGQLESGPTSAGWMLRASVPR